MLEASRQANLLEDSNACRGATVDDRLIGGIELGRMRLAGNVLVNLPLAEAPAGFAVPVLE
ncbi:hypothetical protein [Sinorhizobium medicae]|uniref:hypothetical protein n=1 Tax=Sinorhizobium medicae TaxID=110321 RepID=UPI001F3CE20B|nr:hypothetical protein [Sinorhizobium medicae]